MKKTLLILILIIQSSFIWSQETETISKEKEEEEEVAFFDLEVFPAFPGCEDVESNESMKCFQLKMNEHIIKNFNYPEEALNDNIQGKVMVSFIINTNGDIENIGTFSKADIILRKEARRIIELLPKMKPGMKKGKFVKVRYSIPISFSL